MALRTIVAPAFTWGDHTKFEVAYRGETVDLPAEAIEAGNLISALVEPADQGLGEPASAEAPVKRGPGRPRKSEQN
jgi:hypothetical protein